uniref:Uncharacterized protein n=1 Tax=Arundo donax TaxID=35708 RepID=A0A0A9DUI5_ARUDO
MIYVVTFDIQVWVSVPVWVRIPDVLYMFPAAYVYLCCSFFLSMWEACFCCL